MITLLEDNTILCSDGANINSGHPEKTGCTKGAALAGLFAYLSDFIYDRVSETDHIKKVSFDGRMISYQTCDCVISNNPELPHEKSIKGWPKLVEENNEQLHDYDPFNDDINSLPLRVQQFVNVVVTEDDQVNYVNSLVQKTVTRPVLENWNEPVPAVEKEDLYMDEGGKPQKRMIIVTPATTKISKRQVMKSGKVKVKAHVDDAGVLQPETEIDQKVGETYELLVTNPDGSPVMIEPEAA